MRKSLASRIAILAVVYCAVFCIIVIFQFSKSGSFTIEAGEMTIRGRYLHDIKLTNWENEYLSHEFPDTKVNPVAGGVRIFYAGLEFNLTEERGKGFYLIDSGGGIIPVNPEIMLTTGDTAHFILPTGTIISFSQTETSRGPQVLITADFSENISEAVIPVIPRRSSIVIDSGQLGVMYGGSRYTFSGAGKELDDGYIRLTSENNSISYFTRGRIEIFDASDFIVAGERNYDSTIRSWQESIFGWFNQNRSLLISEDDVTAFLSQSLQRGNYTTALGAVPSSFISGPNHGFKSAAYFGGMTNAYRRFIAYENDKFNLINRLVRERSIDIFLESHILEFLLLRNNTALANDVISIARSAAEDELTVDHIPGLLEVYQDIRRLLPVIGNAVEHLSAKIIELLSDNLIRDEQNDLVFAQDSAGASIEYSMRLGLALIYWAEAERSLEWASIGRSLVLSAAKDNVNGRLYSYFRPAEFYPRAVSLSSEGLWAWTAAQSIVVSNVNGDINLAITFPANLSHHVIIRGVRPFLSLQYNGQTWRSDSQFEIYDSFGWVYYADEQVLVLKVRHNASLVNVRLVYRAPAPAPAPAAPAAVETPAEAGDTAAETP